MQLAPRNPALPFVVATPLPAATGSAPKLVDIDWKHQPDADAGLVTVRYQGTDPAGRTSQFSVRNHPTSTGESWYGVKGTLRDAVRAARDLAVTDGNTEAPGNFARTSVAVMSANDGSFLLERMMYPDGMGDGMDPIISMPIDHVPASQSDVSVPYGDLGKRPFDVPSKVSVRFDDPRVIALVGVDSIAYAPLAAG
ncbi:MAG: hypothetical protein JWM98_262 [Thermoleophilia bacterium]|nr:hypothetical protein [Thermoleophilia bacterium]